MKKKDISNDKMRSALRMREIRESAGLTQEQLSEILGISVSAYKKIEAGENNISLSCLKRLHAEMGISADFILFGKNPGIDKTWEDILNCSETDKLFLMLRLLLYFTQVKKEAFPLK